MVPRNEDGDNSQLNSENLAQIRQEVLALHRDVLQAVRYLSVMAAGISALRGLAAQMQARLAPPPPPAAAPVGERHAQHCHSCGARVTRHPAEAGVLLLCPVCGWSEFVARDGQEIAEVRPDPVPPCPRTNHWAA